MYLNLYITTHIDISTLKRNENDKNKPAKKKSKKEKVNVG